MIMLSRKASEIVQRVTCHFKPHSYFIRTAAPLPSILLLLPNRTHHLQSLLNRLTNQTHFSLEQQLSSIQADPSNISNQTQKTQKEDNLSSIHGIPFSQSTSFISFNAQGKLELTKKPQKKSSIVAVILFSTVQGQQVRWLSSRNFENAVILLKGCALVSVLWVLYQLEYSSRQENHSRHF